MCVVGRERTHAGWGWFLFGKTGQVATQPISFSGQGFSLQGDKSRFVLPPKFRKPVKDLSYGEKTLCIDKHDRWNCLMGFGTSRRDAFDVQIAREEEIATARGEYYDRDLRSSQLFGFMEVPFDDSGRFLLPRHLVDLVGITDSIYCHGAGSFFTIWAPGELAKMGAGWESAQASCRAAEAAARERKA